MKNNRTGWGVVSAILLVAGFYYGTLVLLSGSWTPVIYDLQAPPPGYQSVAAFRAARGHDFQALFEEPAPSPVAGAGHLVDVYDGQPYGAGIRGVDVKTIHLQRLFSVPLRAHLEVPINPALLAHLQSLSKGAIVTVSGIGYGDGRYNINIYPVHRVNGYEP